MKYYSVNKKITTTSNHFFNNLELFNKTKKISSNDYIVGWGKKQSGIQAEKLALEYNCNKLICENGFLHSISFGNKKLEYSIVKDTKSIYYDATKESDLEILLNNEILNDELLERSKKLIDKIQEYELTKYNENIIQLDETLLNKNKKNILIISQVKNDSSLTYGDADDISLKTIIDNILNNNNKDEIDIYIKLHPDVLTKKKENDISLKEIKEYDLKILDGKYNAINLLKHFDEIHTKTSQMGFEALILNKTVYCYGKPFYAGYGLTIDYKNIDRRTKKRTIEEMVAIVYILYSQYYHPINKNKIEVEEVIGELIKLKQQLINNQGELFFFGFKLWKHSFIKKYFQGYSKIHFNMECSEQNIKDILTKNGKVFLWGMNNPKGMNLKLLKQNKIKIFRIEDGFLRSKKLGNSLYPPLSLIVDSNSIYFNAEKSSDIEKILNNDDNFNSYLIERSKKLIEKIKETKISKYNIQNNKNITINTQNKIILVIGQVEDDASIKYSTKNGISNYELLKKVRTNNPEAYILYKPHPDVFIGDRKGNIKIEKVLKFANRELRENDLDSCINVADEVHTISSLSGFEALLRGKKVHCYGKPFYSGWGLTIDENIIKRRIKQRTIEEMVAAVYILYPLYYDYETDFYSTPEKTIDNIINGKNKETLFTILKKIKNSFKKIFKNEK